MSSRYRFQHALTLDWSSHLVQRSKFVSRIWLSHKRLHERKFQPQMDFDICRKSQKVNLIGGLNNTLSASLHFIRASLRSSNLQVFSRDISRRIIVENSSRIHLKLCDWLCKGAVFLLVLVTWSAAASERTAKEKKKSWLCGSLFLLTLPLRTCAIARCVLGRWVASRALLVRFSSLSELRYFLLSAPTYFGYFGSFTLNTASVDLLLLALFTLTPLTTLDHFFFTCCAWSVAFLGWYHYRRLVGFRLISD